MKQNTFETLLYSAAGVVGMFVVVVSAYIVVSAVKVQCDITADKVHTLSPGTKRILAQLDSRVTLRFYCTQAGNDMPPALKTYAHRVEDLIAEYQREAKGKLLVEKFDPQPDSDAEESARLNGVAGRPTGPFGTDKIYLGIAVSLLDEKFVLPWLAPERERLLEYDISRAIARVVSPSRPILGIMSGLPVFSEAPDPLMRPGQNRAEEWTFVTELKKDFVVQEVPLTASRISDEIKMLLVVHPVDISDSAQYAIDQFVLRGGKLLAFLDPHAYFDQNHATSLNYSIMGDNAAKSSLDKLLKAWGLSLDVNKVAADTTFAGRNAQTGDVMPTLLVVTREGINDNDAATSELDNLFLPFAGAFTGQPAEGLEETVLVRCSKNSQLIDSLIATSASEQIFRHFKPDQIEYPLAVRLTGKFKTAFPKGPPAGLPAMEDAASSEKHRGRPAASALALGNGNGEVVLVADSDMLNDKVCVRVQNVMGQRMVQQMNGNLNFLQNLVEQSAGDDDLISSRSRGSLSRPFLRVKAMEAEAGRQWNEKVQLLEARQRQLEAKIRDLEAHGDSAQQLILSSAQAKELEGSQQALVAIGKELKEVRKHLRQATEALEFRTKLLNIAAVPALVAIFGLALALHRRHRSRARVVEEPRRPAEAEQRTCLPVAP